MSAIIGMTQNNQILSIGDIERRSGLYILGKPGMGKTSLIINLIDQDIKSGHGVFFIDPHGDAIKDLLEIQNIFFESKQAAVIDPEMEGFTFGINLLKCENIESLKARTDTYTRAYAVFNKIWEDNWGVWLQLIIQNTLYALIEAQEYTLAEVPLFLNDKAFRDHVVNKMRFNMQVANFWKYEFETKTERQQQEQIQAALTRINTLLSHQYVRDIVGQLQTTIDFIDIMDNKRRVFIKLSAGLPEDIKKFIGTILISELLHAVYRRQNRSQFCIFVDEFQNFVTDDFARLITESRKFGVATTIAHQERYGQLLENRKVLGATQAAGNKVIFQLTPEDAQGLAPEFAEKAEVTVIGRGPELIISPRAVEDLWEKGTSDEYITYPRAKYFWIVDLLKRYPTQAYFLHDPKKSQPKFQGKYMNLARITPYEFDDWDLYRSSSDMLKRGVRLLNEYFYMAMRDGYRKHKITDDEVVIFLKMIELWGGILGFLPAMEPHIPDDMRIVFAQRITDSLTKEREKLITEAKRKYRYGEGIGIWGEMQDESMLKCLEQNNPKLYKTWTKLDIDEHPSLQNLEAWKKFAVLIGISYHELDQIFQWTTKPFINSTQSKALENMVIFVFNMPGDNMYHKELIRQYTVPFMIDEKVRWEALHPNMPDDKYMDACINRLVWQTTEIQTFVLQCFQACASALAKDPVKVPSGKYEETLKPEKSQREIIDEMAQELSNLPRFTAYAKILHQEGMMGEIQLTVKDKITTLKLPDKEHIMQRIHTMENAQAWGESYCTKREAIEQEIKARQTDWKGKIQATGKVVPSKKPESEPPPTSY